jgi:hypothetical protein
VDQTPEQVFAAINNVRGWWSGELHGDTTKVGNEFTYRYEDAHRSKQRIAELTPGKRVAWHVVDAELNFVKDKTEWNGTDTFFDIARKGDKTEVRFTHAGLLADAECFDGCSSAWSHYINGRLRNLITTGKA